MNLPLRLDHAGLGTKDLARRAYERLGFTFTARSMHEGAIVPGGPVVPWGSGNHCAMFRQGYFELLGLVDPALHSTIRPMVERFEGFHIVALACDSADEAYRAAKAAGIAAGEPRALERDAPFGPGNRETRRARFRNVHLDARAYPEARFLLIEHGTPEVLWQPHLLDHPNGAQSLEALCLATPDVEAATARFTALLGEPRRTGEALRFEMPRGRLWLAHPDFWRSHSPVFADAAIRPVAAASIAVSSLSRLEAHFREQGVRCVPGTTLGDGRPCLWVGPDDGGHGILQFTPS